MRRGAVGLNLVVTLPLLVFVLGAVFFLALSALKYYVNIIADLELMAEVESVACQIKDDVRGASYLEIIKTGGEPDELWIHRYKVENGSLGENKAAIIYGTSKSSKTSHRMIYRQNKKSPLTGASLLGAVSVEVFRVEEITPQLFRLTIKAKNTKTMRCHTRQIMLSLQ